ncbi:TonB-dependent receptor [Croceibacterium sp. LX-88]|uniref:TonB-dependent receptor n=1 Tax=Croceibacterium selenioxidans TaxID=2838833 RepID=A0ABS5VZR3_9SPHN|nr:TonB-dependent receptor [Croceibacterium selenioxidans]MBT2133015.1 TonB-dependent receptor [Croceibacterium selenioxidans]
MRACKVLLLTGCAGAFAIAMPAAAQDREDGVAGGGDILVTGSRIVRQDFEANSPIVTVNDSLLQDSSTAALEVNLNKLPQFAPAQTPTAGGDIQPTATNTPGAATVSLRGIGANRNLVLLDGRRSTPSNASGVVDISTIPSAAIERVEIISGGASATYGADAVAGVTNFILKKNVQGLELDAQVGMTQEADGFEYQLSGIMGTGFADGRGNVSLAMSMNNREASYQRDRRWYRDLWADPDAGGTGFFLDQPGINFGFANLPTALNSMFPNSTFPDGGVTVRTNADGTPFVSGSWVDANGTIGPENTYYSYFEGFNGDIDGFNHKLTNAGTLARNNTDTLLILPLTRYNFFARGNYEINDWIGVFGQARYNTVKTRTRQEPGPITSGWSVFIDPTKLDRDQLPGEMWDLLDSRPDPDAQFEMTTLMPANRETFTDVSTYNMLAGLQGSVPDTDWTWEAYVSHGETVTFSRQTGIYSLERLRAVLNSGNFGQGFSQTGNPTNGGFGASTATCTSGLNFFIPPAGGYSRDCLEAISAELKNRSKLRQTIAEANAQGKLLTLPAGDVRGAFGATYREQQYEFINDTLTTQGASFLDQALGIYPSADSFGRFDVREAYGELLVPVLSDIPFIQQFNLELGGRLSDYSTTGTSYTYKLLGDWEVTDWLRFRGGYNRAERAPNIGELFLSSQETFAPNTAGDPCSLKNPMSWSANPANANGNAVRALCEVLMDRSGNPTAKTQFYSAVQSASTSGFAWPTLVGNAGLRPERADTWTAGFVINSPFSSPALSRLKLSVDWFDISVKDAIAPLTVAAALQQCLNPEFNPLVLTDAYQAANTAFCQNVNRNQTGGLGTVYTTYTNSGRFNVQGIDTQLDWGMDVGPGQLSANVVVNYLLKYKSAALPTLRMVDYVGTFGTTENGLNPGAYEYRILAKLNYSVGKVGIGLQWQHLPALDDTSEAHFPTKTVGAPSYNLFHLNGSYALTDELNIRFGVDNLFNKAPPLTNYNPANNRPETTGALRGGSFSSGYYDTNGRRFYLGASARF